MPLRAPALLVLAALAAAGEVVAQATVPWVDRDGCTPVVVHIDALARPLRIVLTGSLGSGSATTAVEVQPGAPATRTLLLPSGRGYGGVRVRLDAGSEAGDLAVTTLNDHRSIDLIALDPHEELHLPELNKLIDDAISGGAQARGGWIPRGSERARRIAADALPDRWQGWPAWLTLVATPAGEAQLNPAQHEAIATWTRCGGALFTTTPAGVEGWRRLGASASLLDPADSEQRALLVRLRAASAEVGTPANHPVPGTAQLPTAWFITLAIAFAAVAGPLNLWWVRRRGAPHLLLITTPLLSLGACVLLVAVALIADGIGRRRSAVQVAILDCPAQHVLAGTAITYFCGISPGGFALDPEDRLLPMDRADFQSTSPSTAQLSLAWEGTPRAEGAWIPARVNRQLAWTQPRPERRRVTAVPSGSGWRIGNGLGVAIADLRWTDPAGKVWTTGPIEAGLETEATAAAGGDAAPAPGTLGIPGPPGTAGLDEALHRLGPDARLAAAACAGPGSFTARLVAPLLQLPGPVAADAEPVAAWVVGRPLLTALDGGR